MPLPSPDKPVLIPDQPVDIGYTCSWFAVRDMDPYELAAIFRLGYVRDCNWEYGIAATKTDGVFISPPLQGWRLVLGRQLPFADGELNREQVLALLARSSSKAGEAQFFATHRVSEFHCWMKAQAGHLVRAYAYQGDHLEVVQDIGARTSGEPADLLSAADLAALEEDEDVALSFPDEDVVMAIAAAWSIDPNTISTSNEQQTLGVVGTVLNGYSLR